MTDNFHNLTRSISLIQSKISIFVGKFKTNLLRQVTTLIISRDQSNSAFPLRNFCFISRFSYNKQIWQQGQFSPEPCDHFTLAVASEIAEDEIKSGELAMESRYLTTPLGGTSSKVIKLELRNCKKNGIKIDTVEIR